MVDGIVCCLCTFDLNVINILDIMLTPYPAVLKVLSIGGASLVDAYHWWNMKIQHYDELC